MSGHVRNRGKSWFYKHELPRDPVTGKRRYSEKGGFRTKRDAQAALTESIARIQRGQFVAPETTTLADFLREWLPGYALTVRETTAARNESLIRAQIIPRLGHARLQDLRPRTLEQFYATLIAGDEDHKPVSVSTMQSIHGVLSRALSDAERDERIGRNPARSAKRPRGASTTKELSVWTPSETGEFLSAMEGNPRHALWHLMLWTGLRRGEALALRWSDVDLENGHLRVTRQLVAPKHLGYFTEPKTQAGRRRVDLDPATVLVLRGHRRRQNEQRLCVGALWVDHDLLFCADDGVPLLPRSVSAWFAQDVKRCGARKISVHGMRHTHATMMMGIASPKVVQERLGHANVSITLGTYSHVQPGMQRAAIDRMADLHGGAPIS